MGVSSPCVDKGGQCLGSRKERDACHHSSSSCSFSCPLISLHIYDTFKIYHRGPQRTYVNVNRMLPTILANKKVKCFPWKIFGPSDVETTPRRWVVDTNGDLLCFVWDQGPAQGWAGAVSPPPPGLISIPDDMGGCCCCCFVFINFPRQKY